MNLVQVDFSKNVGKIKPMHSVNNGPVYKFTSDQRITNIEPYREAGIPYARNHDASFFSTYGGEHIVDVHAIFPNFDADPEDPASYDFDLTDDYCKMIEAGGAKVFYRLGSKIEHNRKKYGTLVPKDPHKWAVICEHIIRHYTEGWADGLYLDIEYWEIWNEPDIIPANKPTWGGTQEQFFELFNVALTHLKKCFPHLKIGGPSCGTVNSEWLERFFASLGETKPDFLSWHCYGATVERMQKKIRLARELLDSHGLTSCESILNEWNYVRGWVGEDWIYSRKVEKGLKGSAYIAANMLMAQQESLDHLMFYDARPCGMNSLFSTDFVFECLKGYYPFWMFNQLYKQKNAVQTGTAGDCIWAAAAKGEEQNVMLCYYDDDDSAPARDVKVEFCNVENEKGVRLSYYLLDADHDAALVREEIFTSSNFASYLTMPLHSTYLLKITAL